jgi:ATP-binding cassette subfamily C (CFTR/MRP) protein 1
LGKSGLLRRLGTTVILVTHAAHRLSYADHIIALSAIGTISEQGTFEHLLASGGYVSLLGTRHIVEDEHVVKENMGSSKTEDVDDTARRNAAADLLRPVGNWAIYRYYIESIGWRSVINWIVLMIIYSVLLKSPGKVLPFILQGTANIH